MTLVSEIAQLRFELECETTLTSDVFHEKFRKNFPILSSFLPSVDPDAETRYTSTDDALMELLVSMVDEAIKIGENGTRGDYTDVGLVSKYRSPVLKAVELMNKS